MAGVGKKTGVGGVGRVVGRIGGLVVVGGVATTWVSLELLELVLGLLLGRGGGF